MSTHTVKLKSRLDIADGTMAFHFEKPEGFQFKPGQYLSLTLMNPSETDDEGSNRSFSIASAPFEEDLMVATRMRDTAFKRVLQTIGLGSEVRMAGPFGSFTLHNDESRAAVFLVGGIGITPFRSIVLNAAKNKLPHRLYLFYSNRRPEDAAFLEELHNAEKQNPNFKFIPTMTQMEKSKKSWSGETGFINGPMLTKWIKNPAGPIYYSAGPAAMVEAMRNMLGRLGIQDDDIRTEEFTGYE